MFQLPTAKEKHTPKKPWEHLCKGGLSGAFSRSWGIKADQNWPRSSDHSEKGSDGQKREMCSHFSYLQSYK